MNTEKKAQAVATFAKQIMKLIDETNEQDVVDQYVEILDHLSRIMLYIHTNDDYMIRLGYIGHDLSKVNFKIIQRGFIDMLNVLVEDYGR